MIFYEAIIGIKFYDKAVSPLELNIRLSFSSTQCMFSGYLMVSCRIAACIITFPGPLQPRYLSTLRTGLSVFLLHCLTNWLKLTVANIFVVLLF